MRTSEEDTGENIKVLMMAERRTRNGRQRRVLCWEIKIYEASLSSSSKIRAFIGICNHVLAFILSLSAHRCRHTPRLPHLFPETQVV